MSDLLQRLKQRKLVQWAIAYVAFAFALIQVLDVVADSYLWPRSAMHLVFGVLVLGFVVALVLAWYHGERGAQRISGPELLLIALVLVVGGGLLWHFGRAGSPSGAVKLAAVGGAAAGTNQAAAHGSTAAIAPVTFTRSAARSPSVAAVAAIATQPILAKSIAVLPFENLSADKSNAYFADGMQDLILTKLADIGDLKVISRTSTESYGSHPGNLEVIAQQLGVATILEGSVQKAGNQVLINVQLIDAKTDSHIWAQSYQRTLDNIFGVEGEVAQKVADALKAELTPAESARVAKVPTTNAAAYDAYLRGEYYRVKSIAPNNLEIAAKYYRLAVAQDPKFALAWARLSHALSSIGREPDADLDPAEAKPAAIEAKTALDHAMALAPDLTEASLAQGWYFDYVQKDQARALVAFEAAVSKQPNDAEALVAVGVVYAHRGQWWKALGYLQKANSIAPDDTNLLPELVTAYEALHRYPEAIRTAQRLVALDPAGDGLIALTNAYELGGDLKSAVSVIDAAPASVRNNPYLAYTLVNLKRLQGDYAAAKQILAELKPGNGLPLSLIEFQRGRNDESAGNTMGARKHYLHTESLLEADLKRHPDFTGDRIGLSWILPSLDKPHEALAQMKLAEQEDLSKKLTDPFKIVRSDQANMAWLQARLGNADAAVKLLDQLLALPTGNIVSVAELKQNPIWDPIRKDPRFQALLKKYSTPEPVSATSTGPAPVSSGPAHG